MKAHNYNLKNTTMIQGLWFYANNECFSKIVVRNNFLNLRNCEVRLTFLLRHLAILANDPPPKFEAC